MNMTSCVLTRQTPLQLYTAIYFAVSDIFLVAQVCWYEHLLYSCRPRVSRVYYHVLEESEREDNEMMNSESGLQSRALPPSETLPETTPSPSNT
jgi:heat shock protein HspQ